MNFNPLPALTAAGLAISDAATVIALIQTFVVTVEDSARSGDDKLTAVLNATEAAVARAFPNVAVEVQELAKQVAALVAGLVALWNSLGDFTHATKAA